MSVNKQMDGKIVIGRPGPFQIIESEAQGNIDNPINAPRRRYDCENYETCLVIAAGLNWDSFTCRGCSGQYEEGLHWRARQEINKDKTVKTICEMPNPCVAKDSGDSKDQLDSELHCESASEDGSELFKEIVKSAERSSGKSIPSKRSNQNKVINLHQPPNDGRPETRKLKVIGK